MPSTIEAITGRFDRFPPLYYEMRLERVAGELESDPARLDLYDDAGVACDRLGRHDEAIEWMSRKRSHLNVNPDTEHQYRYLANLGTFHAHRWIAGGGDRADLADLETAADLVGRAIVLNPDAHFGRERYQLLAIEWLRDLPDPHGYPAERIPYIFDADKNISPRTYPGYESGVLAGLGYDDAIEGLTGLITMGAAWRSVDIHLALEKVLLDQGDSYVARLVHLRIQELRSEGVRSFHPAFPESYSPDGPVVDGSEPEVAAYFAAARSESEGWHQSRIRYMENRLEAGEHPDTHASFWDDWEYRGTPPKIPGSSLSRETRITLGIATVLGIGVGSIALVVVVVAVVIRKLFSLSAAKASS